MAATWTRRQESTPVAPKPLPTALAMMSGERYWGDLDFKGYEAGVIGPNQGSLSRTWMMKNNAKNAYPGGAAPNKKHHRPHHAGLPRGWDHPPVIDSSYTPRYRARHLADPDGTPDRAAVQVKRPV